MKDNTQQSFFRRFFSMYSDGFRNMPSWGRKLWILILIKAFIMFVVLRMIFFPNFLKKNFDTDEERSKHVIEQLTNP